jgi:uncharacterized protein DUF1499
MALLKHLLKNVRRPEIDFATLRLKRKPNQFLMMPEDMISGRVHAKSPVFSIPMAALVKEFSLVALADRNVEELSSRQIDENNIQLEYVAYSKLVGYPDTITVQFMALENGTSTLFIYSRAHYGYRDFGVNARRALSWLAKLKQHIIEV